MPRVQIDVMGTLRLRVDDRLVPLAGGVRQRLLSLLVLRRGRECRPEWLIDALWEGAGREAAMATLQSHIAQLRRLLEPGRVDGSPWTVLRTTPNGYLLDVAFVEVDIDAFVAAAEDARRGGGLHATDTALLLVRGHAFDGVADSEPFVAESVRLDAIVVTTREQRLDLLAEVGRLDELIVEAEALVAQHPLREQNWVRLADAFAAAGRASEGLRALAALRAHLAEHVGLEASAEVRAAERRLLMPVAAEGDPGRPVTRYAERGGVHIAYQVVGSGPTLVAVPPMAQNVEICWQDQHHRRMIERIAARCRFVHFDKRGTGMSDRVAALSMEERIDDFVAVLDAADVERATLCGVSEAGPLSIAFAVAHPERVAGLCLVNTLARATWAPDYTIGASPEEVEATNDAWCREWGRDRSVVVDWFAPSMVQDAAYRTWMGHYMRQSCSPGTLDEICRANRAIDVRSLLERVEVPTVVVHRVGDRVVPAAWGRYLAEHITGASWVEVPGIDHLPWIGESWERIADLAIELAHSSAR